MDDVRTFEDVEVRCTRHGPLTRISLLPLAPPLGAQVSVYRIGDALIDTGSSRVTAALLRVLDEAPPRRILLTHQHEDHIGNIAPIRARFGAIPVFAPRTLIPVIAALRAVSSYRAVYWGNPHPVESAWLVPYDPGDVLDASTHRLETLATPGHTPPHVALWVREAGSTYGLTGDLYASRPLDAFYEAALDETVRSYRTVAALASEIALLPTHGRVRADGSTLLREAADALEQHEASIHATAEALGTRDPHRIAHALYGADPMHAISGGEMGKAVFVRSCLEPARTLPVAPLAGAFGDA